MQSRQRPRDETAAQLEHFDGQRQAQEGFDVE
jgi:hypothetical protein